MNYYQLQSYFLLGLLTAVVILFCMMFVPYFYGLSIALIAVVVAWPANLRIRSKVKNKNVAALIAMLLVLFTILLPLTILGIQLINEASLAYKHLADAGYQFSTLDNFRISLEGRIQAYVPGLSFSLPSFDLSQYAELSAQWLTTRGASLAGNAIMVAVNIFVFLFTLFYLLRDGENFRTVIMNLSLLSDENDADILHRAAQTINAVVRGSLAVALAQGVIAAIGFKIFGIGSPMLWGFVTMFMSLIPGIGTAIVFVPAVGYLLLQGNLGSAIGLLIWGAVAVGLIDNLLRPVLLERSVSIHPFLVLLAVIGGFTIFGPLGFVFGPVLLSLLVTLYNIYSSIIAKNFSRNLNTK